MLNALAKAITVDQTVVKIPGNACLHDGMTIHEEGIIRVAHGTVLSVRVHSWYRALLSKNEMPALRLTIAYLAKKIHLLDKTTAGVG